MGYTHYCRRVKTLDQEKFNAFVEDCKAIAAYAKSDLGNISLGDGWGEGEPVFTSEEVSFNGDASKGEDYETFRIEREYEPSDWEEADENDMYFSFCKTNHKPYDIVVLGCMVAALHHFGSQVVISSDGDQEAIDHAADTFAHILQKVKQ